MEIVLVLDPVRKTPEWGGGGMVPLIHAFSCAKDGGGGVMVS